MKKNLAEFIGTFWLVLGGCGSSLVAASYPETGIGILGVSLAFGLTYLTAYYALGHISGAHLNPAVTIGHWASGRFKGKEILPYVASQFMGAIAAAALLFVIVKGNGSEIGNFAANGFRWGSPGGYGMPPALIIEFVMTFMLLIVFLGATDERAHKGFAGLSIGLALTLIYLVSIPVTNASVNPARSLSQAIFVGDWALAQVWFFIVVPTIGAIAAGLVHRYFQKSGI